MWRYAMAHIAYGFPLVRPTRPDIHNALHVPVPESGRRNYSSSIRMPRQDDRTVFALKHFPQGRDIVTKGGQRDLSSNDIETLLLQSLSHLVPTRTVRPRCVHQNCSNRCSWVVHGLFFPSGFVSLLVPVIFGICGAH